MSKLTSLCGKLKEEVKLSNGETIILKAPKVEDLSELVELFGDGKDIDKMSGTQLKSMFGIVRKLLKQSVPDATDDEIEEVLFSEFAILIEGMTKLFEKSFGDKLPKK